MKIARYLLTAFLGASLGFAPYASAMDNQLVNQAIDTGLTIGGRIGLCYLASMGGTLIHELGHAAAGVAVDKKPEHICIGTSQPNHQDALISNKYMTIKLPWFPSMSGNTLLPKNMNHKQLFIATAAGPLTGLITTACIWPFAKHNTTAHYILMANAAENLANLVPTLSNIWTEMADDGGSMQRPFDSDGDHISSILEEHYNLNLTNILHRIENKPTGRLGLFVTDIGLKILPLYFLGKAVFHK